MAKKERASESAMRKSESKSARFIRVVTPRVNKAVKAINVIGFCAASSYEHTPEQLEAIIKVLTTAIGDLGKRYAGEQGGQGGFNFK